MIQRTLGVVLVLSGLLFFLQGIGTVGGSFMSNNTTWVVLGPVIALVGVLLLLPRRRPRR